MNAIRGSDNAGNWMSDITPGQMKSLDGFIDTALARLDLEKNVKFITGHSLGGLCTVHAIDKRPNAKGIFFNAYKNDSRSRIESYRIKGDPAGVAGHVLRKPLGTSKTAERVSKIGKNHFLRKPFGSTNFKRPSC